MASEQVKHILRSVYEKARQLMAADRFYATLYDPVRAQLEFPVVAENGTLVGTDQELWQARPFRKDAWLTDYAVAQETPLLFEEDLETTLREMGLEYWPEEELPRSWMGAPMLVEGRGIGALVMENRHTPQAFGKREAGLLSTIAHQAAMAIENTRLSEQRDRQIANLQAVYQVGQQLTSGIRMSEPQILELIYGRASQLMDTDNLYIALYDPDPSQPDRYNPEEPERSDIYGTVRFGLMYIDGERAEVPSRKAGYGRTEWIIRTQRPILIWTRAKSEAWYKGPGRREYIDEPFASWVGVPMTVGEKRLGVIATFHKTQDYDYDEEDQRVLSLMASQAAIAIDNSRLFYHLEERVQERTQQLASLHEIGIKITSQLGLEEVLGSIVENANEIMATDFSTLFTYDSDQDIFEKGIRRGEVDSEPSIPSDTGLAAQIAKTQEAVFANDVEVETRAKSTFIKNKKVRSFAGIPLIVRGRTAGVLYINFLEPHEFSEEEQRTILLLANQAAVAIDNARLLHNLKSTLNDLKRAQGEIADKERQLIHARMAADFVHKLSNLAGTIPGWIALTRKELAPLIAKIPKAMEHLDRIYEDASHILREVNDLKKPQLQAEKIDVVQLMAPIVGRTELIASPDIDIQFDHVNNLPWVLAVRSELADAICSIIDNAVRAVSGKGKVGISLSRHSDAGRDRIHLVISDTGCGIPADRLDSIFEYGTTYWPDGEGTGYGLWRAKLIMEGSGGEILVKSEPGTGSTFTILLPPASESVSDEARSEDIQP